jgi:hypothetical protein
VYETDDGVLYALRVDADYFEDASRQWDDATGLGLAPLPRGWRPRAVRGLDDLGRSVLCRVPRTSSALWTGELTVFQFNASDQQIHFCDVVEYIGESRRSAPGG